MPRELIVVTRRMPQTDDLRTAAAEAGVDALIARAGEGAIDIVTDRAGTPVLSVQYTLIVAVPDEVERIAPAAAAAVPGEVFWTEAWARADAADPELAERIAAALARLCDGVCAREDGSLV